MSQFGSQFGATSGGEGLTNEQAASLDRIEAILLQITDGNGDDTPYTLPILFSGSGSGPVYPLAIITPDQIMDPFRDRITIIAGDDYTGTRAIPVRVQTDEDLTGRYVLFAIGRRDKPEAEGYSFRSTVYSADDSQYFNLEMTKAQTSVFPQGTWDYIVRLEHAIDHESQIARGGFHVQGFPSPQPIQGINR